MRDFVGLLATYREEDIALYPEIYVLSDEAPLRILTGVDTPIQLGVLPLGEGTAASILKDCAPLAKEGWGIFAVKQAETTVRFGLFRAQRHSLSTSADEVMRDIGIELPVMLIRNRGFQTVELQNSNRESFTATITTNHAETSTLYADVDRFVSAATEDVPQPDPFAAYLRRLLLGTLQRCHGTLLAVLPSSGKKNSRALGEGVEPSPVVQLFELFSQATKANDADSLGALRSAEILLDGMIGSDGVVLFGSNGSILAYRAFLKMSPAEDRNVAKVGGNRRRTYEVMKLRVPRVYKAAFFRSQDGETACCRSTK